MHLMMKEEGKKSYAINMITFIECNSIYKLAQNAIAFLIGQATKGDKGIRGANLAHLHLLIFANEALTLPPPPTIYS